jgi:putative hydrolase
MPYLSDLHTHTIASGHATTDTISDMAKRASAKGLKLLGITDHGPATAGSATASYFRSLSGAPRHRFGIELLYGVELNILDADGHVDLEPELLAHLDYAIVSMHTQNYRSGSRAENTTAFLAAMQNPSIRILGHCDNPQYPLDYDAIAACAREQHVLLEVNEASLAPGGYRGDTTICCRQMLDACARYQTPVILTSDSHGCAHVGDFTYGDAFVKKMGFPKELIWNNQMERLKGLLKKIPT